MTMGITDLEALDLTCLAAATVAGDVRRRIALRLSGWGLSELDDDLRLVASELVTNACAVTLRGRITVRFWREPGSLVLAVWDASDRMPCVRPARALDLESLDLSEEHLDDNGGRGLQIVRSLASECGVRRTEPTGKWIWCRFLVDSSGWVDGTSPRPGHPSGGPDDVRRYPA